MDLNFIKNTATNLVSNGKLIGMKYSPTILVVGGVAGVIASTVMACKATLKIESVVRDSEDKLAKVRDGYEIVKANPEQHEPYTDEDFKKDLAIVHVQKWVSLAKLYAPAAGLGVLSVAAILGSHGIMTKRNAALMAAYKAVDLGFKKYRENVVDRFGADTDEELRFGMKEKVVGQVVDEQTGEVTQTTKKVPTSISVYARWFDESSLQYRCDPIHNLFYIDQVQKHMNDRLNLVGYVFLNEVYDDLGIPRCPEGQMVGWKKGNGGDDVVDFGLADPRNKDFLNGYASEALLDFNVDGVIYDLI